MKALIISRPYDFGTLEEAWEGHPLTLPVLNKPLFQHHEDFLLSLGVREVRVLCSGENLLSPKDRELEELLSRKGSRLEWSVRAWPSGPFPKGKTLLEMINLQRIFLGEEEALILSAPLLVLEPLTGPKIPVGFPLSTSRILAPQLLSADGVLAQTNVGTLSSLTSPRDFFQTQMRLLSSSAPSAASLKGVHAQAELTPPLLLGPGVKVAAKAVVGPGTILAAGTQVEKGAQLRGVLILSRVRVGKGVEFQDQIVLGNTVVSPERGTVTRIEDKRILAALRSLGL